MSTSFEPLTLDLFLGAAIFVVFSFDLLLAHGRKRVLGFLVAEMLAVLFLLTFAFEAKGEAFSAAYVGDEWVLFFKRVVYAAGALFALGAVDYVDRHFPNRQGEFWTLSLFSLLGMSLLPGARDLLLLVVCFELMGLPLVVLASFAKTEEPRGAGRDAPEAGLKLYLVSAASSAITLYGVSFVFGATGATRIAALGSVEPSALLYLGMLLMLAGMSFKIGAVPFHAWIPDTYQGAPTPFVSFLSVAPKAAGMAALAVVFVLGFGARADGWQGPLVLMVVLSITVGNLLALAQKDLKRLLGFSGIAQVGYMLIGLAAGDAYGAGMLLFYVAGYVVTNMGTFFVLHALAPDAPSITLDDVSGLARRSPRLALTLLLFLLSLAGIPFVVGFWAKLYVFMAAYRAGMEGLVLFGALMAIVSLYYYLQIARAAFMGTPKTDAPVRVDRSLDFAMMACLTAVIAMGAYPSPFVTAAMSASASFLP